jgi:heme-degrading monooxygenase HmoA
MFIAMNRFQVLPGQEKTFEALWLGRDTRLSDVPGFAGFRLLRGPTAEDHALYATHTVWRSKEDFEAWTQSEAFRAAHRGAGDNKPLYRGPPKFEAFEVIQEVHPSSESATVA